MTDYAAHAEKLVRDYRQERVAVMLGRQRLSRRTDDESAVGFYREGLKALSAGLIWALNQYRDAFSRAVPEAQVTVRIRGQYPEDLEVFLSSGNHSLRFISRPANPQEEFQGSVVDGVLHCESTYKGSGRRLESKVGYWHELGVDAWGAKDEQGEFTLFLPELLPTLIESLWKKAVVGLVHSHGEL